MTITRTIDLEEIRCSSCGRWWAHEKVRSGTCPFCADDRISRAIACQVAAERSVSALRGVISKMRASRRSS